MKNRILLILIAFLMIIAVNAQKFQIQSVPLTNQTFSQVKDTTWSQLLGVDVVHFGQTTTHYTIPHQGHTYQFGAFHGIVTSYTPTSVTIIWNVQPYSYGCAIMIETNENGDVRATSHPVIIIPYN